MSPVSGSGHVVVAIGSRFSGLTPRAVRCRPFRARGMWWWRSVLGARRRAVRCRPFRARGMWWWRSVLGARAPSCTMSPFSGSGNEVAVIGSRGSRPELYDIALFGLGRSATPSGPKDGSSFARVRHSRGGVPGYLPRPRRGRGMGVVSLAFVIPGAVLLAIHRGPVGAEESEKFRTRSAFQGRCAWPFTGATVGANSNGGPKSRKDVFSGPCVAQPDRPA